MSGIATLALFCSLVSAQAPAALPPMETMAETELPQLIEQLGSDSFRQRRSAGRRLLGAGAAAKPLLLRTVKAGDIETRRRAAAILADLAYGITPATDPATQQQLRLFRDGKGSQRTQAFSWLVGAMSLDEVRQLILGQPEPTRSGLLTQLFRHPTSPDRFDHPDEVQSFVDSVVGEAEWRWNAVAASLCAPKLMEKWTSGGDLGEIRKIIGRLDAESRDAFILTVVQSSVRTLMEAEEFPFVMELVKQIQNESQQAQAITRFTYDSRVVDLLVKQGHWDEFIKSFDQIKDNAAREQLVQNIFNRSNIVQALLDSEGLEYLLEMAKNIRDPAKRGQVLARLFANSTVQQHLAKEGNADLPKLIAEQESNLTVRREYLKVLLQLIRYRSDVQPSLLNALWAMVKADEDRAWQVETAGYIVQSNLGQRVLQDAEEMAWVLELLGTKEGRESGGNALRYLVQNSNNLKLALRQGHFETLWKRVRESEDGNRASLLSYLFRSSSLMQRLQQDERVDWFLDTIENEPERELRESMLLAVFQNYSAVSVLMDEEQLGRMLKLADASETETAKAKAFGTLLRNSKVSAHFVEQELQDQFLRFAKPDTPPEVRYEYLLLLFQNSTAMKHLDAEKKLDDLRKLCDLEQDEMKRGKLLTGYFANSQVVAKMIKEGKARELLDFADTLNDNSRRSHLQRLFSNKDAVESLLKLGRFDDMLAQIRDTKERYQRTSLFNSLIQSSNLGLFAKHGELESLLRLVHQERDTYARRQMIYYLLGRSDAVPELIKIKRFDDLLQLVESLDERTRADMLLRLFSATEARKQLAKTGRLRKVVDAGMHGSTPKAQEYFRERLFGNSAAVSALVEEGYLNELEALATSGPDASKRATRQVNLYTNSAAIAKLVEQNRLQLLLELAVNQPSATIGTSLFSRIVSNSTTVAKLDEEGRFGELLQLATECLDPTQCGYRKVYLLGSTAMLERLDDKRQIKPMLDDVLNSDLKTVRARLLAGLSNNAALTERAIEFGYLDVILKRMEEDISKSSRARTLCAFLAKPAVLREDKDGAYAEKLFQLMRQETSSYNRSRIIQGLSSAESIKSLLKAGHGPKLVREIEREPSSSRKAYLYNRTLFTEHALRAMVQLDLTKLIVKPVRTAADSSLENYFLNAFSSSSTRKLLGDPNLATLYYELVKHGQHSSGSLQTLLSNHEARDALIAAGHANVVEEALKKLDEADAGGAAKLLYASDGIVTGMLREGLVDEALALAERHLSSDLMMLRYAAALLVTERLDDRLEQLQSAAQRTPEQSQLLVYLLRARGQAAAALELAKTLDNPGLTKAMAVEARDWSLAAQLQADGPELPVPLNRSQDNYQEVETLGLLASYQRLAGNGEAADNTLNQIAAQQAAAPADQALRWHAAQAMLLNGRYAVALKLLGPADDAADGASLNASRLFSLRMYRQEYQQALQLYDLTDEELQAQSDFPATLLRIAGLHQSWGERQQAQRLYDRYEARLQKLSSDSAKEEANASLARHYYRLGRFEDAYRVCDRLPDWSAVVNALFPSNSSRSSLPAEARAWMMLLHEEQPDSALGAKAKIVRRIVSPPFPSDDLEWFTPLAEGALERLSEAKEPNAYALRGLAATCERRGLNEMARRALAQAVEANPAMAIVYADFLRKREQWRLAAEQYHKHHQSLENDAASLYLSGYCLAQAGDAAEGRRRQRQASVTALESRTRHAMARMLLDRGLVEDAKRHLQIVLRTAPPEHWEHNDSHRLMGIHTPHNYAASADHWQVYTLGNLRTNYSFNQVSSYLSIPLLIHKLNLGAAAEAGDVDRARREAQLCQDASLSSTAPLEELAPRLKELGLEEIVDQLFSRSYEHYLTRVEQHPESALLNNNLAWLCAMADRKLDTALKHAEKAVSLSPDSGGYIDTLAEVHFRLGDAEKAVALEKRAVLLAPDNDDLRRQLERFRRGR